MVDCRSYIVILCFEFYDAVIFLWSDCLLEVCVVEINCNVRFVFDIHTYNGFDS